MTTLLHINASARENRSITRELSADFLRLWNMNRPGDEVISRDVGLKPPSFVSEDWIGACFTPVDDRSEDQQAVLRESDTLIAELRSASVIVLAVPMYNYGMPAALKAWFDQVIRISETFSFDLARGDWPLAPIMSGKTLIAITSCGEFGFEAGGIREGMGHLDSHIRACAKYLGVDQTHFIAVEYQEFGDHRHDDSLAAAKARLADLAHKLTESIVVRDIDITQAI